MLESLERARREIGRDDRVAALEQGEGETAEPGAYLEYTVARTEVNRFGDASHQFLRVEILLAWPQVLVCARLVEAALPLRLGAHEVSPAAALTPL
jgi:hypothetical protein